MQIVQGPEVAHFVGTLCGTEFAQPYEAIGFKIDGQFAGGAVFNGYDGRNCDLSVANGITRWPPAFVRYFGDYIWNTLKVHRVTMHVRAENSTMCTKMGAKMEGVLREWYPDGSPCVVFGLLKSEWKLDR